MSTSTSHPIARRTALATLISAALPSRLLAQAGPPMRILLGVPAGSSTDVVARAVSDGLARALGAPVIIDNKPGGSGSIATTAFLAAARDGRTWLMAVNGFFTEAPYTVKMKFDPMKEARPLLEIGSGGLILVGNPALPAKSLRELVEWVRQNKGRVSFASYSPGSLSHVLGLMLNKAEGLDMQHVPYRGSPTALQDLMGGNVQLMFDAAPTSLPLIKAGKLRAYAVTSARRMDMLPEVPTLAELGYPDMTRSAWLGLWTTPEVPDELNRRMRSATLQVLEQPEVRRRLAELAFTVETRHPASPAQLAERLASEFAAIGETLRSINYTPE